MGGFLIVLGLAALSVLVPAIVAAGNGRLMDDLDRRRYQKEHR